MPASISSKALFAFHRTVKPEITYFVTEQDHDTSTITFFDFETQTAITTRMFTDILEERLAAGKYLKGHGTGRMMVKIKPGWCSAFSRHGKYNGKVTGDIDQNLGQWAEVDTDHLFSDQYNVKLPHPIRIEENGKIRRVSCWRLSDRDIVEIKNDHRVPGFVEPDPFGPGLMLAIGGKCPEPIDFSQVPGYEKTAGGFENIREDGGHFPENFSLSLQQIDSVNYFTYGNHRGTNFKFWYKDGKFYPVESHNSRSGTAKVGKGYTVPPISKKAAQALVRFFDKFAK